MKIKDIEIQNMVHTYDDYLLNGNKIERTFNSNRTESPYYINLWPIGELGHPVYPDLTDFWQKPTDDLYNQQTDKDLSAYTPPVPPGPAISPYIRKVFNTIMKLSDIEFTHLCKYLQDKKYIDEYYTKELFIDCYLEYAETYDPLNFFLLTHEIMLFTKTL